MNHLCPLKRECSGQDTLASKSLYSVSCPKHSRSKLTCPNPKLNYHAFTRRFDSYSIPNKASVGFWREFRFKVHQKHFDFIMFLYSSIFCVFMGFICVSLNKSQLSGRSSKCLHTNIVLKKISKDDGQNEKLYS